jgi:hemerythrin
MTMIYHKIIDSFQECYPIQVLLDQLKQLCQIHFMYEEQLLEELDYLTAAEDKLLHDMFMESIDRFKIENNQCHTSTILNDFIKLRLEFITYMLNETKLLSDYIENNFAW